MKRSAEHEAVLGPRGTPARTVLLSGQVDARKPSSSLKRVGRISRRVRGVLDTTIFQTWREAWRTTSWVSERPM